MVYVCVCMCVCVCVCVCDLTLGLRLLYFGGAGHAPSKPLRRGLFAVSYQPGPFFSLAMLSTLAGMTFSR